MQKHSDFEKAVDIEQKSPSSIAVKIKLLSISTNYFFRTYQFFGNNTVE